MAQSGCALALAPAAEPPPILITIDPNASATPTPFQPLPDTGSSSAIETATPETPPAETAAPTGILAPIPANARTQYTFYVTLDYAAHGVAVNEHVRYANTTGQSLSDIVLAVEPNLWTSCFALSLLEQDGNPITDYSLSGQRLTINLAQSLGAGAVTTFDIGYSLSLPAKQPSGTFGYLSNQINLTDWYPFIVPYSDGWVLHDPWPFGENLVYDAADYDVNVQVSDPTVVLAASAPADVSGNASHYHLEAARTFVLSASNSFKVDESAVGSAKIRSYYFAGDADVSKAVVWMASQSLGLYEAKFAAFPYQSLSIVETDMTDGQEYDGLVFLASKFYSGYNGNAKSDLFTIGTHEIAHQWWFGLVGSDQAQQPWLDEALSVYSERLFYQYNYPKYGDWWWNFRVNYFGPQGYVDSNIYSFSTFRDYVNAVYLNGAKFIDDLRKRVGDKAFFAFLKDYAAHFSHGHATADDFFTVLRQHSDKDLSDIMQTYLQGQY